MFCHRSLGGAGVTVLYMSDEQPAWVEASGALLLGRQVESGL